MFSRESVVLLVHGGGGHSAQAIRLLDKIGPRLKKSNIFVIGLCESGHAINSIDSFSVLPFRDKYSTLKTFISIPFILTHYIFVCSSILYRYHVVGVVSTGPGIAIVPSLFFRCMRSKVVFLESWSRFEIPSMTGKVMYRVAHKFYYQNRSLSKYYPNGFFGGLL